MRQVLISFFLLLTTIYGLQAQKLDHRLGYILVQVEKGASLEDVLSSNTSRAHSEIVLDRIISERLGIYLVRFDHSRVHERNLLAQLQSDKNVSIAQFDHLPSLRVEPDDPLFSSQWQWLNYGQTGGLTDADIDGDEAWNTTTGGLTATGDTIVVAIIDDGLDYNHEDIAANAWINHHEIDGNGIDDDENGYIDDIHGWNAYDDTPDVWGQNHGLNVAGMIGAVGNNQIGISGINWNVKIMMIVGGSPESSAIASYAYALEQRILYNESNGEKGAFVVATNSSWGIDFGQPADAPLWCAFYDTLGEHGILSAGATANLNIDIDVAGDLPTACPSEYLLSVTALNNSNERTFSAYGLTQVDFGAPGEDIFTTRRNNQYGTTSGTSFASPVAAGVVALLYSAPCAGFAQLVHTNPSGAAKYIRDLIFMGIEPVPGLEGTLRFGGSLNVGNSMELMMSNCSACPIPFAVNAQVISAEEAIVTWSMIDTADAINARYKPTASAAWDTLFDVTQPLLLSDLLSCTEYEIEFESICSDTSTGFQSNHIFTTDGCCKLPDDISVITGESFFTASWTEVLAADFFLVQWRPEGSEEWIEEVTPNSNITITDLEGCSYYELRLQTSCDTTETGFSAIITIRTKGCGNCIDLEYCESGSDDASEEFIDSLIIGTLTNHSGQNGGYIFYEDLNPDYRAGESYGVWIRPGFPTGQKMDEQFRIWLDANQDGEFGDEELLVDSVLNSDDTFLIQQLTIPAEALEGSTRMRVSMAFTSFFPTNQPACGLVDFGEVEDYCVNILRNPDPCAEVDTVLFDAITFTSAFMYWPETEGAIAYTYRWREVGTIDYDEMATIDTTANLTDLEKCKTYEVQIRTVCTSDTTSYVKNYLLETDCDVAVKEVNPLLAAFKVFPNPATDFITLRLQALESGDHNITLYNMQGQRLRHEVLYAEPNEVTEIRFDGLEAYPPGLYFAVVEKNGKTSTKKFIKM
ncbi:MAG: S8 family serine peptidase [Saprospiraceae bacterium]|nr:S8 family serine peptidase [Saprospiraceae bacterium]